MTQKRGHMTTESVFTYFETHPYRGVRIRATQIIDSQAALVVFLDDADTEIDRFQYPAYRVWNISAHAEEWIDGYWLKRGAR